MFGAGAVDQRGRPEEDISAAAVCYERAPTEGGEFYAGVVQNKQSAAAHPVFRQRAREPRNVREDVLSIAGAVREVVVEFSLLKPPAAGGIDPNVRS